MRKLLLLVTVSCLSHFAIKAQSPIKVKGTLTDASSHETLLGATVGIAGGKSMQTGLDGSFSFDLQQGGNYTFHCTYVGYKALDTTINISASTVIHLHLNSSTSELSGVTIAGRRDRETESSAKRDEKNAAQVMNVISAKAIQLSPDIIIANVLQRVSGVSLERSSSGDGRYAIIRGMDQRYNYTLINGVKIPSPDSKNRYVPLDLFPADLVERVEVSKALTPDMEGDAVGGVINMVMKSAPDQLYINASVSTGYSQNLFNRPFKSFPVDAIRKQSMRQANGPSYLAKATDFTRDNLNYTDKSFTPNTMANVSIGNRFFDKRLGVMVGASYQNTYKAYSGIFNPADSYIDQDNAYGVLNIKHSNLRDYSNHVTRVGLNGKVDLRINSANRIELTGFYAVLNEAQTRLTTDTLQPAPRVGVGTGQVWWYGRSKYQHETIGNAAIKGEHAIIPGLKFNWTGVYSKATNSIPDQAEYEYDGGYYADGTSPQPYQHPLKTTDYHRIWQANTDRDLSGYGNLAYSNQIANIPFTITAGGMYRDKKRNNTYDDYLLRTVPNGDGSFQTWTDIYHFNWSVFNPEGTPVDPGNYQAAETVSAQYGMIKFRVNKLETVLGSRIETTNQSFETAVPVTSPNKTGKISYSDALPSVNFKYMLNDKTNLRLSYFASINRPSFIDIIPSPYNDDEYKTTGNPDLKHATADNIDFRYELFPNSNEQILLGAFYKNIQNPIEYGFVGQKFDTYEANNFGNATNYGFEAVYEKYIGRFGVRANYTYTHSAITTAKARTFNRVGEVVDETRPMQGQSAHVANAALLYKDNKHGIDLQLAWQYTGSRIALVSPYYHSDVWQKGFSLFDLSGEKRFAKKYSIFVKAQNLLNAADKFFIKQPIGNAYPVPFETQGAAETLQQRSQYGQTYQVGFRYIF